MVIDWPTAFFSVPFTNTSCQQFWLGSGFMPMLLGTQTLVMLDGIGNPSGGVLRSA